jgi:hypothetical protein
VRSNLVDGEGVAQSRLGGGIESSIGDVHGLRAPVKEEKRVGLSAVIPDVLSAAGKRKKRRCGKSQNYVQLASKCNK